jgi:DNA helicase-2/ATP-dependent DNA helicase PcrA
VGLGPNFAIFDDDDQMKLVGRLIKQLGLDEQVAPRTILSRIDRAKNRGLDPAQPPPGSAGLFVDEYVTTIAPLYQAQLARENAVDFNDILLFALRLCRHPEVGPRLGLMFRHVLVDEFQDTNLVQYELVGRLAAATRNLTVVGDDDQSIYGWRGAEPRNLIDFHRDFPDAPLIKLEENYRSTQVILDAANAVIAGNRERLGKQLWTSRAGGDLIDLYTAGDERGEAYRIAQLVRGLIDDGPYSPGDIAVLYRTNAQSRVLEEQLRAVGVQPHVYGLSFFDRKEVKDVFAYLRLIANPAADSAFERIVNVPPRGIGETTIERVREQSGPGGLYAAARDSVRGALSGLPTAARRKLTTFVDTIEGLRAVIASGASVAEVVIQTVERSGMRARFEAEGTPDAEDRLKNLAELVTVASDYDEEAGAEGTLDGFLEKLALTGAGDGPGGVPTPERDQRGDGGRGDRLVMMTVHLAKGLEFPVVFLAGMEDGLFPSLREREDHDSARALEEERRLAYVAITRAKERLHLSWARTRRVWGQVKLQEPSRFLAEVPAECMARPAARAPSGPPSWQARGWGQGGGGGGGAREAPGRRRRGGDEYDQRPADDEVVYDVDADVRERSGELAPGTLVEHPMFGQGRVIERRGAGKSASVVIDFAAVGRKTIAARFVTAADDGN